MIKNTSKKKRSLEKLVEGRVIIQLLPGFRTETNMIVKVFIQNSLLVHYLFTNI